MWESINDKLLAEPETMIARGKTWIAISGALLIAGAAAWMLHGILPVIQRRTPAAIPQNLGDLWAVPWLTWVVPESGEGLILVLLLAAFGFRQRNRGLALQRGHF